MRSVGRLGTKTIRLEAFARMTTSMADTGESVQELKPRGDSDDANRRLVKSRSPFLRTDARLDAVPERCVPAKDERVIRDSTRGSSLEFVARGLR